MFFCKCVHESTITCMFPCITPVSAHFWPPLEKGQLTPLSARSNVQQPHDLPVEAAAGGRDMWSPYGWCCGRWSATVAVCCNCWLACSEVGAEPEPVHELRPETAARKLQLAFPSRVLWLPSKEKKINRQVIHIQYYSYRTSSKNSAPLIIRHPSAKSGQITSIFGKAIPKNFKI